MPSDEVKKKDDYAVFSITTYELKKLFKSENKRLPTDDELMKMIDDIEWYGIGRDIQDEVNFIITEYILDQFPEEEEDK